MRLYIHWPFCVSRCSYCDFNSRVAGRRVMHDYRKALIEEMQIWSSLLSDEEKCLKSIYLGGGTPSTLAGREVGDLLKELTRHFRIEPGAEITLEVNPATWSYSDFTEARSGGINRFSIGVQSLDDNVLRVLGRSHRASEAKEAIRHAFMAGGATVSVDVIYSLPSGGLNSLTRTLDGVLAWRPHHISAYALSLEEKTPLARRVLVGEIILPGEDEAADQYLVVWERLSKAGYEQYEISNFCLPGCHSRHNLAYWRREEYLGVGAGAHSLLGKCRFSNLVSLLGYIKRIDTGLLAVEWSEMLDTREELKEAIMLGLRTSEGIPGGLLKRSSSHLENMENIGLLERRRDRIRLTREGMLLSNAVIGELLPS